MASSSAMSICWPFAGLLPHHQGRLNGDDAVKPGEDVGKRHTDFLRLTVRLASEVHDTGQPLDHEIITRLVRIWPGLAKARQRQVDQLRVQFTQGRIIEAVLGQAANLEVLHKDIRVRNQRPDCMSRPSSVLKSTTTDFLPRLVEWK